MGSRPPTARVEAVQDTNFGVTITDPYRWMEQESGEFDGFLTGQAAYARDFLDGLPHRPALLARLRELRPSDPERHGFAFAGDRVFNLRSDPDAAVAVLVIREETERVLLDPNAIAGEAHSHLDWYVPSPDGRYVACAISSGGAENCTVWVVDVDTGGVLDDAVGNVRFPFLSWSDDGKSLTYHRYLDPPAGAPPDARRLDSRTYRHRLGDDPATDEVLLARGLNPRLPLAPRDRPFLYRPPGSDWAIAVISHSALGGDYTDQELSDCTLYVAPSAELTDPVSCRWVRVAEPADEVTAFALGRDTLYLVSHRDAPRGRVMALPLAASQGPPTVLVLESERVIEAVRVAGDWLLVRDLDGGASRLRRFPLSGGAPEDVPLPLAGTILEWTAAADRPAGLLRVEPWATPPQVYWYDADSGEVIDTGWGLPAPPSAPDVEVHQVLAPARDGTPIPVTVVHRRGLARDSTHPTLLQGYGSYGLTFGPPWRSLPELLAWVERGGVWAVAHIRGGGEYGHDWHRAGRLLAKENTITDFIDCAEYLVAQGYTTPARLAGMGGSAGGIPAGGALVRRPDLWAAIVLHIPLVNALRAEFSENGPINVPEFGSVSTEEGLRSLLIVDSYNRVRDGTPYPAVLLTTGRNDRRVPTWQPGKMAARLRAATAGGRPVLLRVEEHGGHGGIGATTDQIEAGIADRLAFLLHQLDGE